MKSLSVAGLLFLSLLPHTSTAAENLLQNGGFEEDRNADGNADRWFSYPKSLEASSEAKIETIGDPNEAAAGGIFVRLSRTDGKQVLALTQKLRDEVMSSITEDPEKTLVLKGKIRVSSTEASKAYINLQMVGYPKDGGERHFAGRMSTPEVTTGGGWQDVVISFKPADVIAPNTVVDHVEINCILLSPQGSADFDELSLAFEKP